MTHIKFVQSEVTENLSFLPIIRTSDSGWNIFGVEIELFSLARSPIWITAPSAIHTLKPLIQIIS